MIKIEILPPLNGERLVVPVISRAVNIDVCVDSSPGHGYGYGFLVLAPKSFKKSTHHHHLDFFYIYMVCVCFFTLLSRIFWC